MSLPPAGAHPMAWPNARWSKWPRAPTWPALGMISWTSTPARSLTARPASRPWAGSCSTCCSTWPVAARRPGPSGGSCTTRWCCSTRRRSPDSISQSFANGHRFRTEDDGVPGQVHLQLQLHLSADNALHMAWSAQALDAPTVVNLTGHAFFNLAGAGSTHGHFLQLPASRYLPLAADICRQRRAGRCARHAVGLAATPPGGGAGGPALGWMAHGGGAGPLPGARRTRTVGALSCRLCRPCPACPLHPACAWPRCLGCPSAATQTSCGAPRPAGKCLQAMAGSRTRGEIGGVAKRPKAGSGSRAMASAWSRWSPPMRPTMPDSPSGGWPPVTACRAPSCTGSDVPENRRPHPAGGCRSPQALRLGRRAWQIESEHQVAMLVHGLLDPVAKRCQKELCTFTTGEFHRRHEVAVGGDQHDHLRLFLQRQRRDVHADAHVHALLGDLRLEIVFRDFELLAGRTVELSGVDGPAIETQLSETKRHQRLARQMEQQLLRPGDDWRLGKLHHTAIEGPFLGGFQRHGVVVVHAVQPHVFQWLAGADGADETLKVVRSRRCLGAAKSALGKTPIHQNSETDGHADEKIGRRTGRRSSLLLHVTRGAAVSLWEACSVSRQRRQWCASAQKIFPCICCAAPANLLLQADAGDVHQPLPARDLVGLVAAQSGR